MAVRVFNLLGGMLGADGWADSTGMLGLGKQLAALPNVQSVTNYSWYDWKKAAADILAAPPDVKIAVPGYSGGGSRATDLANYLGAKHKIDLMVLYDPSLASEMQPVGANVLHAVCYHNPHPAMWLPLYGEIGGGVLVAPYSKLKTVEINNGAGEFHLFVQINQALHDMTVNFVRLLG